MTPGGRKKGSRNKFSGEPHNLSFWRYTLKKPEEINVFLDRGSQRQKDTIKEILIYLKTKDIDFFIRVNGEEILMELTNE